MTPEERKELKQRIEKFDKLASKIADCNRWLAELRKPTIEKCDSIVKLEIGSAANYLELHHLPITDYDLACHLRDIIGEYRSRLIEEQVAL